MKDGSVRDDGAASGTSLTLLERARQGDSSAWKRLVALYTPLVFYWSTRGGLQPADAEEICQDVFLAVARKIHSFRHDRAGDTFRGWLRTIMRNKIKDHVAPPGGRGAGGSDAQGQLLQLPATAPDEPGEDEQAEEMGIVYRRAVELIEEEFEPNTRRAFWLVVAGRPTADVAAELHMSRGAVYIAKSRVLKRLRDEFGDLLETSVPNAPR
jgi:RNA polymerase sigma-70 factor, ECF subfamily